MDGCTCAQPLLCHSFGPCGSVIEAQKSLHALDEFRKLEALSRRTNASPGTKTVRSREGFLSRPLDLVLSSTSTGQNGVLLQCLRMGNFLGCVASLRRLVLCSHQIISWFENPKSRNLMARWCRVKLIAQEY